MEKIILVALMAAMIATPCLAQEIEPEGMFSVDGTLWEVCGIIFFSIPPFISLNCGQYTSFVGPEYGFYQGKIYSCTDNICTASTSETSSYTDLVVVSFAYDIDLPPVGKWIENNWNILSAIMQPIGLGVFTFMGYFAGSPYSPKIYYFGISIMHKINDNWTPPGIE